MRFLITPLISVILTLLLLFSTHQILRSQKNTFREISDSNLIEISETGQVISALNNSHSHIVTLLMEAENLDEEKIYERGRTDLNYLHQIETRLKKIIQPHQPLVLNNTEIFAAINSAYDDYRYQVHSAIEMSTVDVNQASREIILANQKLEILNHLFLQLSQYYSDRLRQSTLKIEHSLQLTHTTELALALIVLMVLCALYFSKKITSGLTKVHMALVELAKGNLDIRFPEEKDAYIRGIWDAVRAFKEAQNRNIRFQRELVMQKYAMDQHSIVATTDIKGTITDVNEKFCDISGYDRDELIGQNHRILNSGNQPKDYWRQMYLTVSSGQVWRDEVLNKAKGGEYYWVDTSIIPIYNTEQPTKISGYIAIRTDITEKKAQFEKLIEAKIEAETAVIAKSRFLNNMSHELRTPMNGVIGMLDLLLKDTLHDSQRRRAEIAKSSADTMLLLINDILDFTLLDTHQTGARHQPFHLTNTIKSVVNKLIADTVRNDLTIQLETAEICSDQVIGDPEKLKQILNILISNAIKFTHAGEVIIEATLSKSPSDPDSTPKNDTYNNSHIDCIFFCSVRDTGIGIPSAQINTLFEPFTQVDSSSTRRYGGTGLGLAICKKLITLLEGSITVTSEEGVGSEFRIQLPLQASLDERDIRQT